MLTFQEYSGYDALGLADLVRRGDTNPAELMGCAVSRLNEVNPRINAVVARVAPHSADPAVSGEDSVFHGVPFLVKDLLANCKGEVTGLGSVFCEGLKPSTDDSSLVTRFRAAGLQIFGKTATPELGILHFTETKAKGITRNPWNLAYSPGGSSGGSAAAVAAGIVPMASGGDGGGSIRGPASCTGLFGLKPSRGRLPVGPRVSEPWFGFAIEHALTRSVRDSAALLDATAGALPGGSYQLPRPERSFLEESATSPGKLRVAVSVNPVISQKLHPDCRQAVENSAKRLAALGHEVVLSDPPVNAEEMIFHFVRLLAADTATAVLAMEQQAARRARAHELEPRTRALIRVGCALTAQELVQSLWALQLMSHDYVNWLAQFDVAVSAVLGSGPLTHDSLRLSVNQRVQLALVNHLPLGSLAKQRAFILENSREAMNFTGPNVPANVAGLPSMSVPMDFNAKGLPIGTLFTAGPGNEALLFRLAGQLEAAYPWFDRRPAL